MKPGIWTLFAAVTIGLAVTSAVMAKRSLDFVDSAQRTGGVIVGHKTFVDDEGRTFHHPRVRYQTKTGRSVTFVTNLDADDSKLPVGTGVSVLYFPERPVEARLDSFESLWGGPAKFAVFAFLFAISTAIVYALQKRGATAKAVTPSLSAGPTAVAQWDLVLASGHDRLYAWAAYGFTALGLLVLAGAAALLIVADEPWPAAAIFALLGLSSVAGGAKLVVDVRRNAQSSSKQLRQSGHPISATVSGISKVESLEVSGRNPWRILAEGVDPRTGKKRIFESGYVWEDPSEGSKGESITVWLDPSDDGRYWVDVDSRMTSS